MKLHLSDLPNCDICKWHYDLRNIAVYDARIHYDSRDIWAHVCRWHFHLYDGKLGLGMGTELKLEDKEKS